MLQKSELISLAEKVVGLLINNDNGEGLYDHLIIDKWEWPQGVALYSLFKFAKITGKAEYLNYMAKWYEKRFAEGLPVRNVNTTAPMLGLACLYEEKGGEKYLELIKDWAEWVMKDMPRTDENGLQHITTHDVNEQQIWDDTLFMTVLFLGKAGKLLGRQDMVEEAVYQFLLHIKYLFDSKTGLWFHGWCFEGRHHFGEALWARGNSWYTSAVVEFIEILGLTGALRDHLVSTLKAQIEALVRLQDESGLWHTLLDDPGSYVEVSAAAGFAYGMLKAVRMNLVSQDYKATALKAVDAVISNIGGDGIVQQVSYGTAMGINMEHYKNIPICPTAYGQGLTFLMLTELLSHI